MCDIGKKMFDRRKELGLTLEEVGNAVGVGKSTVRKWENGMIKNMGRDKIALIANILQMSPVEFVPCDDSSAPSSILNDDEKHLINLYRGANDQAKSDAIDLLEKHQKKGASESDQTA